MKTEKRDGGITTSTGKDAFFFLFAKLSVKLGWAHKAEYIHPPSPINFTHICI